MFCRQCGAQIRGTGRFCPACGAEIERREAPEPAAVCAECGASLKNGAKFCKQCGTKVSALQEMAENACAECGAALKAGARFCKQCGAPADGAIPVVNIPVRADEPVTSVTVSNEPPIPTVTIPVSGPVAEVIVSDAPPAAADWVCPECGMALRSAGDFCPECSLSAVRGGAAAAAPPPAAPPKPQAPAGSVCPTCGAARKPGKKYCNICGTALAANAAPAQRPAPDKQKMRGKTAAAAAKGTAAPKKAPAAADTPGKATELISHMVEAQLAAGECALPMELDPIAIPAAAKAAQSLPALLGGGIKAFFSNLFGIFKSGRKLFSLLILGAIWVAVELLEEKGVDSDVLRLLSTITAAEEDFGKGAITRGFAAAFVCSFLGESGSFKKLFRGIGQFFSSFGKRKGSFGGLLMGLGAALLFACFMEVGDTAPVVLQVFAALLALRSLGGNGYGRRILAAVLPRKTPAATSFLAGWALGVGLAMPFSEYLLQAGGGCLLAGFVCSILFRGRKEAAKA